MQKMCVKKSTGDKEVPTIRDSEKTNDGDAFTLTFFLPLRFLTLSFLFGSFSFFFVA